MPSLLPSETVLRFHLSVQRSRAAVTAMLAAAAFAARATGVVEFEPLHALLLFAFGMLSVVLFSELYRAGVEVRWGIRLMPAWMGVDLAVSTVAVVLTGDRTSLWLIWYLANTSAAAFVAGWRGAVLVAGASCGLYLGALVYLGKIGGLDAELLAACGRLALLYGGSFFFVRGIAELRDRRLQVARLMAEKSSRIEELSRVTAELESRGQALAAANLRIREADRAKSQFLASMSHELRTPLNSIIGFSEILGEKLEGRIEPRFVRFLHNILGSGRHLLGLINDVLDLSKIEAGKMELAFEPTSLLDLVRGVESVMHGVAARRGIDIELLLPDNLPPVVADPPRVKQVLYNLLSNAVKFSPDDTPVTMRVRGPVPAADSPLGVAAVELSVSDRGPGIPVEQQEAIFEEFRQLDGGTDRALGGTGLGLALVRRFVELHGGRVVVDSAPGAGSTFTAILPLDPRPRRGEVRESAPVVTPSPAEDPRPVVLVVEDDDEFFRALAVDLEGGGYRAVRVSRGEEAMELVRSTRPAVIVLDLVLPGRDGWEVLRELKASPDTSAIPVLVVSLIANHELGFALGAADYFVKPLLRERFMARLREVAVPAPGGASEVLVIDDDPQLHDLLEAELGDAGFDLRHAFGGREGLEMARQRPPAVIVLDLMMPETSGFEVAAELERDERTAAVPVLVLTARELSRAERTELERRMAAVISKSPGERGRLIATIRRLERGRRPGWEEA